MSDKQTQALNGGGGVGGNEINNEEEEIKESKKIKEENLGGGHDDTDDREENEDGGETTMESNVSNENNGEEGEEIGERNLLEQERKPSTTTTTTTAAADESSNLLPIVIDDLADLGIEWLITKNDEGIGNWGKQYETTETLENVDDGQLDIEMPPPMPEVNVTSHGQTLHLVPLKEDGRTSTTLTWIRKTALRKDSASDRRITIRGLCLGDLFHPRIYTLIQMGQSIDYSSTDRTLANTCQSGILTINFRTILDRIVALRRYLLDIEIIGRRLEIVCTFPDHKRPPDFETLWQAYAIEGVPPCASQRPDREILAKQIVVKNLPAGIEEEEIRKYFNSCDEIEFVEDYNNHRCAIVTFVDVINCHLAHARQNEIIFENGTRPQIYLMTDTITNSKLMPRRAKEETDEERQIRHTFEVLWNHQQRVANAMHLQERFGGRGGSVNDYQMKRNFQTITKKLPLDIKQRIEDRAHERKTKEVVEKEKAAAAAILAAQQEALKEQQALAKASLEQQDEKNGTTDETTTKTAADESTTTPAQKRPADTSPGSQSLTKRPKRKNFRGGGAGNGGGAGFGTQRRGGIGGGGLGGGNNRRDQLFQYRGNDNRGPMHMSPHRGGGPSPRAANMMSPPRYGRGGGGGAYMNETRANPWLVPPQAGGSNFDRHMDSSSGAYGAPPSLMSRRDLSPLQAGGGITSLFGDSGGGMAYAGQGSAGYMGREMDMRRSGGGGGGQELYQRRDAMGPDFQRSDYRGFYGKR